MKLSVDAAALAAALKRAACERRATPLPILGHVLLQAEGSALHVRSTNLQCWTSSRIDADVQRDGEVCLRAEALSAIAGSLSGPLVIDEAVARQGRGRWKIDALPPDQFPAVPDNRTQPTGIDSKALAHAIDRVAYATGVNDVRHYFNGVFVGRGFVIATDGYRLARCPIGSLPDDFPGAILPGAELPRLLAVLREGATVAYGNAGGKTPANCLSAHGETDSVRIALIDQTYPQAEAGVDAILSSEVEGAAEVDREDLLAALRRMLAVATQRSYTVGAKVYRTTPVGLHFEAGGLRLSSVSGDHTEVVGESSVHSRLVGCNAKLVADAVSAIEADKIVLRLHSQGRGGALLITPTEDTGIDEHLVGEMKLDALTPAGE